MKKIKVHIDWSYTINPKDEYIWENANENEADVIISVNNINQFNQKAKKVLWLLEPKAIRADLYTKAVNLTTNYDLIVSHCDHMDTKVDHVQIYPCVPSWIDESDRLIYNKTKDISMIASKKRICEGHIYRHKIASLLQRRCDIYGFGRDRQIKAKVDGLKDYMFSIAMENCCVDTYFTEKILDCFLTGTIPIYWGTKKICNVFDENGIIFLDYFLENIDSFDYTKEYETRNEAIKENFKIAKEKNYRSEDGINQILSKIYKGQTC